ncbi:hypothetical protein GGR51DRAFT_556005 [Nemania sp. FL0031]|nr:hypothetical protein GGR51DRAFT_556005 [Nemania sp. FL0031]
MSWLKKSPRQLHSGVGMDGGQSSGYNKIQATEDSIELKVDLGARTAHPSPRLHTSHMNSCNDKYEGRYGGSKRDDSTRCAKNSPMSKAQRADCQPSASPSPETGEGTGSSTSLTIQLSTTDRSNVPMLDFSKTRRQPHEYMHKKGGYSGFSMLSSTASPVL